jgi:dipeptidyl-peptidase-4
MLRRRALFFALGLTLAFAQKKPVTLDDVAAPPPSGRAGAAPAWSPDGASFAYTEQNKIMLYDLAAKNARELAPLDQLQKAAKPAPKPERYEWENRRVRDENVQWFPSGKKLLIAAGGDLFIWRLDRSEAEQLTATPVAERDPKISPDGHYVAFRREHDLYVIDVASKTETRLTKDGSETLRNGELDWVYPEELDLGTAYWWSPDSKWIAYLQFDVSREPLYPHADLRGFRPVLEPQRYPQAGEPNAAVQVGVIPAAGGRTRWMDVGETRYFYLVARVAWAPDSRHLAIQRLTRVQNRLDLLSADAASGATQAVLTESDPHWINVKDDFRFLKGGREFLWSSERTGFRHLYVYSSDGTQKRQLTRGDWEVRGVLGADEKTGRVFYLSSEPGPLETQMYALGLNGEQKVRLTAEPGTHAVSLAPDAAHFLDSFSSLNSPPRRVLRAINGSEYAVFQEADRKRYDQYEILPTEILKVKAADGRTDLYARLIKPAGFQPGRKYPAIVMVYGGPGAQSVRDAWSGLSWEQALAHRGFVIWQLDNRGSAGRGHGFETPIYHNLGVTELADQKAGIARLISLGFVDPARIGIYGWSYGGFMTLNALLNAPEIFHAGIAGAPVTYFANYDTIYTERYMGLPVDDQEGYSRTNLSLSAANLKARLMLVHNFQDDNVLFQNTLQIADALERAGKEFQLMLYPQKTHGVTGPVRRQMLQSMTDFFEDALKAPAESR